MVFKVILGLGICFLCGLLPGSASAERWQDKYRTIQFSRISSENEADRIARHRKLVAYLEKSLGVKVKMHVATEYAGTIEALRSRKVEFAILGPASFAAASEITGGRWNPFWRERTRPETSPTSP